MAILAEQDTTLTKSLCFFFPPLGFARKVMCYAAGRLNTDLAVHDINLSLSREKGVVLNVCRTQCQVCWEYAGNQVTEQISKDQARLKKGYSL